MEVNIIVLRAAACDGVSMRVERLGTECLELLHREQALEEVIVHDFNFVDFVGSTETIKEMHDRNRAVDRDQMRSTCEIHTVLNAVGAHHDHAGLTACIDVLMITKDGKSVSCEGTCRNMYYARKELTLQFVEVGDHKQQSLGCRKCGCQCTCLKRTVDCAGCAALRLHLNYLDLVTKYVGAARSCPCVDVLCHRG